MLILVPKTTNRLHYIFELIIKDLLGISLNLQLITRRLRHITDQSFIMGTTSFGMSLSKKRPTFYSSMISPKKS